MADLPISGLPVSGGALDTDELAANQGGTTVKLTLAQIKTNVEADGLAAHIASNPATHAAGSITSTLIANRTRTFWVNPYVVWNINANSYAYPGVDNALGGYGVNMIDNERCEAYGRFCIPNDYVSGMTMKAVFIPLMDAVSPGNKNLYYANGFTAGACGETPETHKDNTAYEILVLDVPVGWPTYQHCTPTFALTDVAAGDIVFIYTIRNSTAGVGDPDTVNKTVIFVGWMISYTADS